MKKILVTGGTGFIGKYLIPALLGKGFELTLLTRAPEKYKNDQNITYIRHLSEQEFAYDIIINLAGETIAQYWTTAAKHRIYHSRINTTKQIIEHIAKATHKPRLLINGSAIGYYGASNNEDFKEDDNHGDLNSFAVKLCKDWEDVAYQATQYGVRTCTLRTGIVLERDGGTLAKLHPMFKYFLGAHIGSTQQFMSWIHMDDLVNIILFIINNVSIYGPVNATSIKPVSNEEFTTALGDALFRPVFLTLPEFFVKTIYGQMGEEILLKGQKVYPKKLIDAGFKFKHKYIIEALKAIY